MEVVLSQQRFLNFKQMAVPRKIVFTAPNKNKLHPKIQQRIEELKAKNNNWGIFIFDDHQIEIFIEENYDEFCLDVYRSINPKLGPAKADLFRYLYIYKRGGVYLDIKSSFTGSFSKLINEQDDFIVSSWGKTHPGWGVYKELGKIKEFQQWFIISSPGNPIIKEIINKCLLNLSFYNPGIFGVGKTGVVRTTGPVTFTQEMIRSETKGWRRVNSEGEGLIYSIFGDGFSEHGVAFKNHYLDLTEDVVAKEQFINREKYQKEIQNLITLNDQKINRSKSKVKKFKLHEYSIERLKKELELNPTDFFVLSQLSKNLIAAKKFKEAIEILKLQVILRPYCRQSYETIFNVQEASRQDIS